MGFGAKGWQDQWKNYFFDGAPMAKTVGTICARVCAENRTGAEEFLFRHRFLIKL